jgi:RES domain-containing protein
MRVTRLCKRDYSDLDGKGAAISGGQWNSPGRQVVYNSDTALAILEYRVHMTTLPKNMLLLLPRARSTDRRD